MKYQNTKKLVELLNLFLGFVETNLQEGKSLTKTIKNVAAAVATKGKSSKIDFKSIASLTLQGVSVPGTNIPAINLTIKKADISAIKKETDAILKFLNGGVLAKDLKLFKKLATQIASVDVNQASRLDMYVWATMLNGQNTNLYLELSGQSYQTFSKSDIYAAKLEAIELLKLM